MTPSDTLGGVLEGVSPKPAGGCSAKRYLFRVQLGGVGSLPLGSCRCEVGQAPGMKRPMVIIRLVTISSSLGSDSASKELTDSTAAGSSTGI